MAKEIAGYSFDDVLDDASHGAADMVPDVIRDEYGLGRLLEKINEALGPVIEEAAKEVGLLEGEDA